jgi:hypothetical protein
MTYRYSSTGNLDEEIERTKQEIAQMDTRHAQFSFVMLILIAYMFGALTVVSCGPKPDLDPVAQVVAINNRVSAKLNQLVAQNEQEVKTAAREGMALCTQEDAKARVACKETAIDQAISSAAVKTATLTRMVTLEHLIADAAETARKATNDADKEASAALALSYLVELQRLAEDAEKLEKTR